MTSLQVYQLTMTFINTGKSMSISVYNDFISLVRLQMYQLMMTCINTDVSEYIN